MDVSWLERGMSGVADDAQVGLRPYAVQIPCAGGGADDIVTSLHDGSRNVPDARHVVEQLRFTAQKAAIHEVVAFYASHCERELILAPLLDVVGIAAQEAGGCLPYRPGARGRQRGALLVAGEALVIGTHEIVALVRRDRVAIGFPVIGEQIAGAMLIEPTNLGVAQQKDSAQHQLGHPIRVCFGVGQRERAAPRPAEYQPALEAQMLAKPFDIRNQVPGRVLDEAGAGTAAAAATLIEYDDAVVLRIKELPRTLVGPGAGSAVQKH